MTGRNITLTVLLSLFLLTAGCRSASAPTAPPEANPTPVPTAAPTPTPTPDPIQARMDAMTVEEKVGQLLTVGFEGTVPGGDVTAYIQDYRVGGLILFGRNIESAGQLTALTNGLKELSGDGVPLFLAVDQEGGRVDRMPPEVRRTPSANRVGEAAAERPLAAEDYGGALAAECAAFGLNVNFAPVLDVWSDPGNTVIGDRSFGSDPSRVAYWGSLAAQGLSDGGVIPAAKHFPGHGDTATDSHLELPVVDKSPEDWDQSDFTPFWGYLDTVRGPIMVSHILLTALDDAYPATLSHKIVTGFLRTEQGFDGVVFTDDMTMGAITQNYGLGEACVLAVEAGCDVLLVCHGRENVEEARSALLEAVDSGRITQERLDESVRRVLTLKAEYDVSSDPVDPPDLEALNARIDAILAG